MSGSFGLKLTNVALMLALGILLARELGPQEFGYYSFAMALMRVLAVPAQLGYRQLLLRFFPIFQASGHWEHLRGIAMQALCGSAILGALIGTLVASGLHLTPVGRLVPSADAIFLALPLLIFLPQLNLNEAIGLAGGRIVASQLPTMVLFPLIALLLIAANILWVGPIDANAAVALTVAAAGAAWSVGWLLRAREAGPGPRRYRTRSWLSSAWPLVAQDSLRMLNQHAALLLLGFLAGSNLVGQFQVAHQVAQVVSFGLVALNTATAPTISHLYTAGEQGRLQRLLAAGALGALVYASLAAICLALSGHWLLPIVFGEEYASAVLPLLILVAGQVVNAASGSVLLVLNMIGRERVAAVGTMIGVSVNIAACAVLIPLTGVMGAAIAATLSLTAWNAYLAVRVYRITGLKTFASPRIEKSRAPGR